MSAAIDFPTHFSDVLDLARLPWFSVDRGRLVLSDHSVGPIIDAHTHLALVFLPFGKVDLECRGGSTRHFLPTHRPLDLNVYTNANMVPADIANMKVNVSLAGVKRTQSWATHTTPNLLREMSECGVVRSNLLAVEYPVISRNARRFLEAALRRDELTCFGSVHPHQPRMKAHLDRQVRWGALGIKVHPGGQMIHPSCKAAMKLYRLCAERNLPIFFHCGPVGIEPDHYRRLSLVENFEKAISENTETTFVLGHSGGREPHKALDLQLRYSNVYLDLSCQGLDGIGLNYENGDPDRIVKRSDWPINHQAISIAKVLILTEGREELRRKVLHDNFAGLVGLPTSS